jgi:hypothetical protein
MAIPALKRRAILSHPSGMMRATCLRKRFANPGPVLSLTALFVAQLLSGCILPGAYKMVETYEVKGRLLDAQGQPLPGREVVLLQPEERQITKAMVATISHPTNPGGKERCLVEVTTDLHGEFEHKFHGLGNCHPIWLFPPLFELPCKLKGPTHYGKFFLLRSPDVPSRVYQIEVRRSEPRIRVLDPASAKLRRLRDGEESITGVTVQTNRVFETAASTPYSKTISVVRLEITPPRSRE